MRFPNSRIENNNAEKVRSSAMVPKPTSSFYPKQVWIDFVLGLKGFMKLVIFLPNDWTDEVIEKIVDDYESDQQIPAEAPHELMMQIFFNLHDPVDDLTTPGKFIPPRKSIIILWASIKRCILSYLHLHRCGITRLGTESRGDATHDELLRM